MRNWREPSWSKGRRSLNLEKRNDLDKSLCLERLKLNEWKNREERVTHVLGTCVNVFSLWKERKKERTKKEDNETKVYLTELTSNLPLLVNFVLCLIFILIVFFWFLMILIFLFFLFPFYIYRNWFYFLKIIDFVSLNQLFFYKKLVLDENLIIKIKEYSYFFFGKKEYSY
jgi:hypothetical protein